MRATARIEAGVCGFITTAVATSEDGEHVLFEIDSDCGTIRRLAAKLAQIGALDAYAEISATPGSVLLDTARQLQKGSCAGCVVPAGLFKAMQVAARLNLSKDIAIRLTAE